MTYREVRIIDYPIVHGSLNTKSYLAQILTLGAQIGEKIITECYQSVRTLTWGVTYISPSFSLKTKNFPFGKSLVSMYLICS